jgi:hypothetical protein
MLRPGELIRLVQVTNRLGARGSFTYRAVAERARGILAVFATTNVVRMLAGKPMIFTRVGLAAG